VGDSYASHPGGSTKINEILLTQYSSSTSRSGKNSGYLVRKCLSASLVPADCESVLLDQKAYGAIWTINKIHYPSKNVSGGIGHSEKDSESCKIS
jgi:hypothetical protein